MICDVLLTKKDRKFIARVCQYPEIIAEDDTESEHPWLKHAGMFADDSDWEPFQESVRQYRKEIDSETAGA